MAQIVLRTKNIRAFKIGYQMLIADNPKMQKRHCRYMNVSPVVVVSNLNRGGCRDPVTRSSSNDVDVDYSQESIKIQ